MHLLWCRTIDKGNSLTNNVDTRHNVNQPQYSGQVIPSQFIVVFLNLTYWWLFIREILVILLIEKVWWFCWSHLSHWAWNKGYHRYSWVCFIPWPTSRNWQWWPDKNETTTKETISMFPLWTFHLYVATFQQHLHREYITQSWSDIPELVVPIMLSLIEGCC